MKTIWLVFVAVLCLQIIACKSDDTTTEEQAEEVPAQPEPMPWTFLTAGVFHNNATVVIGEDPGANPNKGQWLNFEDDGTYTYGLYEDAQGKGVWTFDNDNKLLEMFPGGTQQPTEWRVMSRDDNLILVGTTKHGNNAQQLRYSRKDGFPTRE